MIRHVVVVLFVSVFVRSATSQREYTSTSSSDEENFVDNRIDLTPTRVSSVEKFLQTLANPFRIFNRSDNEVEDNVERFILGLPSPLKNVLLPSQRAARQSFGDVLNIFRGSIQTIYPGTLWCGSGDLARSDDEVGLFRITDSCCRVHDSCPYTIGKGHEDKGLQNNGLFTRSLCSCDEEFRECLKNASTLISTKIGITYFNILQPQCFKLDHPIKRCLKYERIGQGDRRCLEYELDQNQDKTWQWFDNPEY